MQDIYLTFEFDKIREKLKEYSKTELGKERISNLIMLESIDLVKSSLDELKEVLSVIQRYGPLPIQTSANAIYLINTAKKTGMLTPRDLNLICNDIVTSQSILKYLTKIGNEYPLISNKVNKFYDLSSLEKEINRVITPSLTVNDNATSELKDIRKNIKKAEEDLQNRVLTLAFKYSCFLNDDNATIRDGHFVLPVKTGDKNKVSGIVYDVSDSGNTTFIEPLEIVELNNKITALKVAENEEVRKILKQLTNLVLLQESEILNNNSIIADLDFISSKAQYALLINADIAELSSKQVVDLIKARHPLIDSNKVVSNDYHIDEDKRIVIISGPNAGGKTVSLKTVGMMVLMNQCGLAIPASRATLGYFKNIYIDIGDNQSLSDNLSTFSAHMSHISEIVDIVKGKDLVLLDELGTGTDPREGEALALATTKYLENKNCLAMISSHFDALKEYAFLSKNLENSSMVFDEDKLLPTYKFRLGAPGHSYALDVAKRYGIRMDIILESKRFLEENNNNDASELLLILQSKIEQTTKLESELNKTKLLLESKEKELEIKEDNIKVKRDNLLKDVEKEKTLLLKQAKEEIDEVMNNLSKEGIKLHEVIELKKQIDDLEKSPEAVIYNEQINIDDYVSVPSLGVNGKVIRLKGNKARINGDNGISFDVEINKLHKIDKPKEIKKRNVSYSTEINTKVGLELNIIGMHVEEANNALKRYLDDCMLKNMYMVRIIHGFGSGALRKMTREYLDSQHIKYRAGNESEGAGGATVVILRDQK